MSFSWRLSIAPSSPLLGWKMFFLCEATLSPRRPSFLPHKSSTFFCLFTRSHSPLFPTALPALQLQPCSPPRACRPLRDRRQQRRGRSPPSHRRRGMSLPAAAPTALLLPLLPLVVARRRSSAAPSPVSCFLRISCGRREIVSFSYLSNGELEPENRETVLRGRKTNGESRSATLTFKPKKILSSSSDDDDGGRCFRLRGLLLFQLGPRPQARGPAKGVAQGGQGRGKARAALLVPEPGAELFSFRLFSFFSGFFLSVFRPRPTFLPTFFQPPLRQIKN